MVLEFAVAKADMAGATGNVNVIADVNDQVYLPVDYANQFTIRTGTAWSGQNVDDVRGGIFQGVTSFNGGEEVKSRGYWVELMIKPADVFSISVGASADNPIDEQIFAPGAGTNAPTGALANHILYVANRFMLGSGVTIGVDVLHWTTTWGGSLEDGVDNRINVFIQWNY